MTLLEAIQARHAVRKHTDKPIPEAIVKTFQAEIDKANAEPGLHIQLVLNEPKAYNWLLTRGMYKGVTNYFAIVGKKKNPEVEQKLGYYGEKLVILAQTLGLNTCWTANSSRTVKGAFEIGHGEKVYCCIGVGYGETQGEGHKIKTVAEVSNAGDSTPAWFLEGVKAALLAPTAMNQQKFFFEYVPAEKGGKAKVVVKPGSAMMGFTVLDSGIAMYNFEVGAGAENFEWA